MPPLTGAALLVSVTLQIVAVRRFRYDRGLQVMLADSAPFGTTCHGGLSAGGHNADERQLVNEKPAAAATQPMRRG